MYARDALAKSVYERVFNWLVIRLNQSLQSPESGRKTLLGILDIYGFEIFEKNGYVASLRSLCVTAIWDENVLGEKGSVYKYSKIYSFNVA